MYWNCDAFFAQGKTHTVCQDYARAGVTEDGYPFVLVCDGCSSSPDTDFGARVLAFTAASKMGPLCRGEQTFEESAAQIMREAYLVAQASSVSGEVLDSTLIAAYRHHSDEGEGVRVSLRGDGVILARIRSGSLHLYEIEHLQNAPRYLSYDLDPERFRRYLERFGDAAQQRMVIPPATDICTGFNGHPADLFFEADTYDFVMILSDGAKTFQRTVRTNTSNLLEPVPLMQVVEQLVDIKSNKGAFLQRRGRQFLTKFCAANGWQHADDLAVAAIWMGDEK